MNDAVEPWIKRADEDLAVARHALEVPWLATACFHAHQAAEKYLKAVLVMLNTTPPRTHDLDLLADLIEANVSPLDIREASLVLTQYAVDARYPGTDIDEEEAKEAVSHAESIHNWASRVLQTGLP